MVNIWTVGSATNVWTLKHNKSPITSLCFDSDELYVASGAQSGSLKVYDLSEGKLARNLGTHQTNVTSLQFHPYGGFIASGCADASVKVWDVKEKSCISTFKSQSKEVTCVRFSPDGKWLASSSKDGTICFWDIVASKSVGTIKLPAANYVTSFEFNPADVSMAAITTARTVEVWDLDTMKLLSATPAESLISQVRAMAFSSLHNQMLTAAKGVLKAWDVDPSLKLAQSMDIPWERIVDMKLYNNSTLVAAGCMSNFVSVWELDLDRLAEEASAAPSGSGKQRADARAQDKEVKETKDSSYQQDKDHRPVSLPSAMAPPKAINVDAITYKDLYEDKDSRRAVAAAVAEEEDEDEEVDFISDLLPSGADSPAKNLAASVGESFFKKFKDSLKLDFHEEEVGVPDDELDDLLPPSSFAEHQPRTAGHAAAAGAKREQRISPPQAKPSSRPISTPAPAVAVAKVMPGHTRSSSAGDDKEGMAVVGMRHLRLDAANNRLDEALPRQGSADPSARINAECHQLLDKLLVGSRLQADLSNRLTTLRSLRQQWTRGQVLDTIQHLQDIADGMKYNNPQNIFVLADFFMAVELRTSGAMSLDGCVKILPVLQDMLNNSNSHAQNVIHAAYKSLSSLLEAFGELIRNTRSVIVAGGVDLSREARLNKCNACHNVFQQARARLDTLKHQFRQHLGLYEVLDGYQRLCSVYC